MNPLCAGRGELNASVGRIGRALRVLASLPRRWRAPAHLASWLQGLGAGAHAVSGYLLRFLPPARFRLQPIAISTRDVYTPHPTSENKANVLLRVAQSMRGKHEKTR